MKTRQCRFINDPMAVLLLVALLVLVSCATKKRELAPKSESEQQESGWAGMGAQIYETSITTTSTVVSIDPAHRTLELRQTGGTLTTYKAGQEVPSFAQIKVGDRVKTTVGEERVVDLAPAATPLTDRDKVTLVRSPNGGPLIAVNTRRFTAQVVAMDYYLHTATLRMAGGETKTVNVSPNINLAAVNPGDEVSVQVSEARTFTVMKE